MYCKICFRTKLCYKTLCETSHMALGNINFGRLKFNVVHQDLSEPEFYGDSKEFF